MAASSRSNLLAVQQPHHTYGDMISPHNHGSVAKMHIALRDGNAAAVAQCSGWGTTRDNMGLRIGSVFIILVGSLLGAFLPMLLSRTSPNWRFSKLAFFVCKYFGSGVILSTAFMHLLSPAVEALSDDCLSNILPNYDWGHAICLMTIMAMFYIELMAARFNFSFGHSHGPSPSSSGVDLSSTPGLAKPSKQNNAIVNGTSDLAKPPVSTTATNSTAGSSTQLDIEAANSTQFSESFPRLEVVRLPSNARHASGLPNNVGYPPGTEDHLAHGREHVDGDSHASYGSQIVSLLILEFGVVFHSLFIGLSLAGSDNLKILLIVIAFHQFFEGLGLGSRLAVAEWPSNWKNWTGIAMALGYGITTPVGIAIGLGVNAGLTKNPDLSQLVNGVFDAVSSGILVYTALVELLAHEFMFNPEMRDAKLSVQLFAFCCVAAGVAVMAVLAKWA